jgi:hypothetical protein
MSPDRPSAGAGSATGCRLIGHPPVLDRPSAGAGSASGCRRVLDRPSQPDRPSAGAGSASGCRLIGHQPVLDRPSPALDRPGDRRQATACGSRITRHGAGKPDHAPRPADRVSYATGARAAACLTQGRAGHKKAPAGRRGQGQGGGAGRYRFNGTRGAVVWPRNVSSFRDAAQPARASSSKTKKQRDSSGIDRGAGGGAGRGRGWKPRDDRKGAAGLYQPECESNCITVIFKTPKENGAGLPLPLDNRISGAPSIYHGITGSRDHGITRP